MFNRSYTDCRQFYKRKLCYVPVGGDQNTFSDTISGV